MAADTYTMPLSRPIDALGETLHELELKDPDAAALDGIEFTLGPQGLRFDAGSMVKVIASAAGIPPPAARKIPMRDVLAHTMAILDFLGLDIRGIGES